MKNSSLPVLILLIIVITPAFSFFLTGCGKNVKENILPPDVYYKKAVQDSSKRDYSGASKNFKALIENYPAYHNTKKAELKLGDAYYLEGKYIEAQGAYLDFLNLHPHSKYAPFAMFYEAMSFYKRKEAAGRTQGPLKSAKKIFKELISDYPYSKYAGKSFDHIKLINAKLAENTFYTGLYYYNASLWKPAAYMFKAVLGRYGDKNVPVIPKTLYYLVMCYKHLNNKNKEMRYIKILKSKYPKSKYAS